MLKYQTAKQFRKDLKKFENPKPKLERLFKVMDGLIAEVPLDPIYQDHSLEGNWKGSRVCHVQPDLLLIYTLFEEDRAIKFERFGSHAELFG
jgi:mRNA interferase YafQ